MGFFGLSLLPQKFCMLMIDNIGLQESQRDIQDFSPFSKPSHFRNSMLFEAHIRFGIVNT
jgi:hypothetical protein